MIDNYTLDPKYCCVNEEYKEIYEDLLEDLVYRSVDIKFNAMYILHENSIRDLLSNKLRFRVSTDTIWSNYVVSKMNSGILGLSMESIYERKDYMNQSKIYFDNFLKYCNPLLFKNKKLKKRISKIISEYLKEKFKDMYKLISLKDYNFHVGKYDNGSYYADFYIDFMVERS